MLVSCSTDDEVSLLLCFYENFLCLRCEEKAQTR